MIDKHIYFDCDTASEIEEYSKKHNLSFTKSVRLLVKKSLKVENDKERFERLEEKINKLLLIQNDIRLLLEQTYSDIGFENMTDPNKSKTLREFKEKIRKDLFND